MKNEKFHYNGIKNKYQIILYEKESGEKPFEKWMEDLDRSIVIRVMKRLNQLAEGHKGPCRYLSDSLWELKFTYGAGIRIYFMENGNSIILLLCAGNKGTQKTDILKARQYVQNFRRRYG